MRYALRPELMRRSTPAGASTTRSLGRAARADVLCAPSLSGESFGMVLTEAFAAGTPVIASAIAGYSDVVTHGVDGVLVPPADPQRLAEELQRSPGAAAPRGDGRRRSPAPPSATPGRGRRPVTTVYERRSPRPSGRRPPSAPPTGPGMRPADGAAPPAEKLPSLDPAPAAARAAAASRAASGSASPAASASASRARGQTDRPRQGRLEHRPLRRQLGPRCLRA